MTVRHLPVRPDLDQLRHQAKDLLRELRRRDPTTKLAGAQHALARSYGLASWPRLVLACRMTDAIWRDDVAAVRALVVKYPALLHEDARGVRGNWGPPMTYAANLGRDRIIELLRGLGAADLQTAFDRACLQGQIDTARSLHALGARPDPDLAMGPAETQNARGLAFVVELGAPLADASGDRLAPVALVLQTYARNAAGKHACLELFAEHGIELPDTPPMAVHRGRINLLERHLAADAGLLVRTFAHREIYPPSLGCHADEAHALCGTPLDGATLLHMAIDHDELEIATWLLERGADPDVRAAIDADAFGGHTPLFAAAVSQATLSHERDAFARLLLDRGANPNARASLRKALRHVEDESLHEYRDVTPRSYAERFHEQRWVSRAVLRLIIERGGLA